MTPTLNSMAIMGVVRLPGMMTGQILGGASPDTAVRDQIVIMFILASSTALGCLLSVQLAYRRLFDNSTAYAWTRSNPIVTHAGRPAGRARCSAGAPLGREADRRG